MRPLRESYAGIAKGVYGRTTAEQLRYVGEERGSWVSSLENARVVVTGGAGNVGSQIVDAALAAGAAEVVAVDALVRGVPENLVGALATGRARLLELDIRDRAAVTGALAGADYVFHQAALRWTLCQEDPRLCQEVMVDGTFNVLEAAAAAKVRRVVMASSALVYGEPAHLPMDEDLPLRPTTIYGAAKAANEQLGRAYSSLGGMPVTSLRYFNVYGPRMDIRSRFTEVMVKWLDRIDAGQPLLVFGDGSSSADYVYVGDVVRANLLACEAAPVAAVLNICSGIETPIAGLAALLLDVTGSTVGVEHRPAPVDALAARRVGDPRLARETLGFDAEVGLAEGIRRLIAWRREALAGSA